MVSALPYKELEVVLLDHPKDLHFGDFHIREGILAPRTLKELEYHPVGVGHIEVLLIVNLQGSSNTGVVENGVSSIRRNTERPTRTARHQVSKDTGDVIVTRLPNSAR